MIRTADAKGRVTVGKNGEVYSVSEDEEGVITLQPVRVPTFDPGTYPFQAVYWTPEKGLKASPPGKVLVVYTLPKERLASKPVDSVVGSLAEQLGLPVVIGDRMSEGAQYHVSSGLRHSFSGGIIQYPPGGEAKVICAANQKPPTPAS